MKHKLYETYGFGTHPDPNKIKIDLVPDPAINKPTKAWWGSPVKANYGWKDWCLEEEFHTEKITKDNRSIWTLKDDAKILYINSTEDLYKCLDEGLLLSYDDYGSFHVTTRDSLCLSNMFWFESIKNRGYSAIELTDAGLGHYFSDRLELMMNSWDCQSIVVLDKSKIDWKIGDNNGVQKTRYNIIITSYI